MTPSAVTPSASSASSRPFIPVTDDPGAASIIAETMTKTKEVKGLSSLLFYFAVISNIHRGCRSSVVWCMLAFPRCWGQLQAQPHAVTGFVCPECQHVKVDPGLCLVHTPTHILLVVMGVLLFTSLLVDRARECVRMRMCSCARTHGSDARLFPRAPVRVEHRPRWRGLF